MEADKNCRHNTDEDDLPTDIMSMDGIMESQDICSGGSSEGTSILLCVIVKLNDSFSIAIFVHLY